MRSGWLLALIAAVGCGRIGFGSAPDGGGSGSNVFQQVGLPPGGHTMRVAGASGVWYALTAAGVFKSTNAGSSWSGCGADSLPIEWLVVDPSSGALYAGGDGGVSGTTDGCATWHPLGLSVHVEGLVIYGTKLLAGSSDGVHVWNGTTWSMFAAAQITVAPIQYLAVAGAGPATPWLYVGGQNGLQRYDGTTWTQIDAGLVGPIINFIATDPLNPMHVLAQSQATGSTVASVSQSTNGGVSWTYTSNGGFGAVIDPANTSTVILSDWTEGLEVSTNGGSSFSSGDQRDAAMHLASVNDLFVDPTAGMVVAATNRGLFAASTSALPNLGGAWTEIDNGISAWTVNGISVTTKVILLATYAGLMRSDDGGTSWTETSNGLVDDSTTTSVVPWPGQANMFATASAGLITQYDDANQAFTGLWTATAADNWHVSTVRLNPSCTGSGATGEVCLYAGSWTGVVTSTNATVTSTYVHHDVASPSSQTYDVVAVNAVASQLIVGNNTGIYTSTDSGTTWQATGPSGPTYRIVQLANGSWLAGTATGIYHGVDTAGVWTWNQSGLVGTEVDDLLVTTDRVVAASVAAVFVSADNGATWEALPGLETSYPQTLAQDPSGNLWVGTYSRGLFKTALP